MFQMETLYLFQWEVDQTVINCFAFSKILLHLKKKQLKIVSHSV